MRGRHLDLQRYIQTASRLRGFDTPTVWNEFSPLADQTGSVNLGQGLPNWQTPDFIKEAMVSAVRADLNQSTRSFGDVALCEALAKHYAPLLNRKSIDHMSEVTVCVGATEGIYAVMMGLVEDGDEVIVLEPAFDIYPAQVQMAGGTTKFVPIELIEGQWKMDMNKLESSITEKTKVILLNTPHNPTGKVFTRSELEEIADILRRNPHVVAVSDEVYEKLVYDARKHVHLSSLPGMWDQTITISSAGKTFSATGWKVGWAYGAAELIKPLMMANQWIQFSVPTPNCRAIAEVLEKSESPYEGAPNYFDFLRDEYERKRDHLGQSLEEAGLRPVMPQGGFFIVADAASFVPDDKYFLAPGPDGVSPVTKDWAFARWLTHEYGVTNIPMSAFYTPELKPSVANLGKNT
jgi:kynurenine--oxoglutarate transaminase/cysteine-S-conjugate beta-lyase/glutamine--phenylpyruvate transaminase